MSVCRLFMIGILVISFLQRNDAARSDSMKQPVEEGFVSMRDGARLYYSKYGNGPNIVILPAGLFLEKYFTQLIRPNRTLIFYDMRNRGRSDYVQNTNTLTIQQDVEDLEQLRNHFEIKRFSLIGISYLGEMVVLYAAKYPQFIERVIQIGAVPMKFGTKYQPQFTAQDPSPVINEEASKELQKLEGQGYHQKYPREFCERQWNLFRPFFVGDAANAPKLESPCHLPNEWPVHFNRHLEHHFTSVQKLKLTRENFRNVQQPVLTIHGTKDRNAPYGAGREWAFLLPNARLLTLPEVAHFPWVEVPEIIMPAIDEFLNGSWPERAEKISASPLALGATACDYLPC